MKKPLKHARGALCLALSLLLQPTPRTFAQQQQQQPKPAAATPAKPAPVDAPQDDEEVIRLSTGLVQLTAVVTDKQGHPVENLAKEDFEILENGLPREIGFFSVERAPESHTTTTNVASEASRTTAARPATATPNASRTIVLFVDTLHLAPLSLNRAKTQLKRFVDEQMTDADLVAVVATSGTLGVLQQFTRDRRMLKYAIDRITLFPGLRTSITPYLASRVLAEDEEAISEAVAILGKEEGFVSLSRQAATAYATDRSRDILAETGSLRGATLRALGAVSERLAAMKGQRLIAFVSDGFSLLDDSGSDRSALDDTESRAARAGVMIYAIYPKGLVGPNDLTSGPVPGAVEGGNYQFQSQTDVQSNLRELAQATGGEAFLNTNDTLSSMRRMLDANRLYYSLAYYLPKDSDKKFRKLTVRVRNHPDYTVRTQRGYAPPSTEDAEVASSPRQRLVRQMLSPLPATALGVTSSADFLARAGDDAQVTLRVHIDGERLQYEQQGENSVLHCEVAGIVLDRAGKIADNFSESLAATLTPQQLAGARRAGYRYERRLKLPPGLYQVRIGVRELASEKTGTSASWVEVPDLNKGVLALSSLFLGQEQHDAQSSPSASQRAQPKLTVGSTSIKSGDSIFYRFVVYTPAGAQPNEATIKVEIVQGSAKVYEGDWQPLAARVIRKDEKGVEAGGQLRLTLPAGVYTLRVSVKDPATKKTAQRESDFEVGA
jgi:VWFA-related protein